MLASERRGGEIMRAVNIVRVLFGFMLLAGAAVNTYLGLTRPDLYASFADAALLKLYNSLWQSLILPYLGVWLALVVAFELTTGLLILSRGVWVKVGLAAALLFFLFLVPFWWQGGALINVLFIVVVAWLLRYDYDRSILDIIAGRPAPRP
jgi:hypothetical protein